MISNAFERTKYMNHDSTTHTYVATIGCGILLANLNLEAIDKASCGCLVTLDPNCLIFLGFGRTRLCGTGRDAVHIATRAGVATVQGNVRFPDAEHAVHTLAGGHVGLAIISGAHLGAGLERTILGGIPADEASVVALLDVHGAGDLLLGTGQEVAADVGIARHEASVGALLDVVGAGHHAALLEGALAEGMVISGGGGGGGAEDGQGGDDLHG